MAGNSNRAIKRYARAYQHEPTKVMTMGTARNLPTLPALELELIAFFEGGTVGVTFPHHDPLVIMAEIAHCEVARVLG